jgi:hypothetical protein
MHACRIKDSFLETFDIPKNMAVTMTDAGTMAQIGSANMHCLGGFVNVRIS